MLTAKQLVSIARRNSKPPWLLSELQQMYRLHPLSLRTAANAIQVQQVYLLLEVRDPVLLTQVKSYAELQAKWKKSVPSKATLSQFEKVLNNAGGSIRYVSSDWRRAGVTGSMGGFAGQMLYPMDAATGWGNILQGVVIVGGVLIALATLPASAPAAIFLTGVGLTSDVLLVGGIGFEAGATFGYEYMGINQVLADTPADVAAEQPSSATSPLPVDPQDAPVDVIIHFDPKIGDGGYNKVPDPSTFTCDPTEISTLPDSPPSPDSTGDAQAGDPGTTDLPEPPANPDEPL